MYTMQLELPDASTPLSYARKMKISVISLLLFQNSLLKSSRQRTG
jgi:hypothetical protein